METTALLPICNYNSISIQGFVVEPTSFLRYLVETQSCSEEFLQKLSCITPSLKGIQAAIASDFLEAYNSKNAMRFSTQYDGDYDLFHAISTTDQKSDLLIYLPNQEIAMESMDENGIEYPYIEVLGSRFIQAIDYELYVLNHSFKFAANLDDTLFVSDRCKNMAILLLGWKGIWKNSTLQFSEDGPISMLRLINRDYIRD